MEFRPSLESSSRFLSYASSVPTSRNCILPSLSRKRGSEYFSKRHIFRASVSASPNGAGGFSWSEFTGAIRRASQRFRIKFGDSMKKKTALDLEEDNVKEGKLVANVKHGVKKVEAQLERFNTVLLPEFIIWNRWERWKDSKNWDAKTIYALVICFIVFVLSSKGVYTLFRAPYRERKIRELTEAYMEALIPGTTFSKTRRLKKGFWRKTSLKGLKMKKYVERPDGTLVHDSTFLGKDTWDEDLAAPEFKVKQVDIPLDPFLFEKISNSGVEVHLLPKQKRHYFVKLVTALLPGILLMWMIRDAVLLLHVTCSHFLYKKYNQLFDADDAVHFILPVGDIGGPKSMCKEVVLSADVWDLLDELMIYIHNPRASYERGLQLVQGVLLSGPPGTGKTLFARTMAKESGLPFVFASGAEFTNRERSGPARINQMFSIARRNAPSFIFVDEIDAIAGRRATKDPRTRATFEALITQLNVEKERIDVDRQSLRQAVIFICATNRPEELDPEFVRGDHIDHHVYFGLPDSRQRVQIFYVHSAGKQLAEDVNFEKLVFRTVGFSGADIRNLVNEAAIMSVRKGHSKINQQDIIDVLDKQVLEGMGLLLTEEEQQKCEQIVSFEKKRLLAVHEAGHIVLAHLLPRFDLLAFSQLLPGGKENAISVFYPREDVVEGYTTYGYMIMQMVVAHGGRCAERIVFGDDITDGGTHDLEKITKIAREMAIASTMSFGLDKKHPKPDDEFIKYMWDDPQVITTMTPEVSELFVRELTRYIEETEDLAITALRENRHILDVVTSELLKKSRITGLEVEEKMKDLSPIMFEDF